MGEEVYRIFCKRVARSEYPQEADGVRFNAPCERPGVDALNGLTPPATPRFTAMVQRRTQLVAALDQVFGDAPVQGMTELFAEGPGDTGELDQLLKNLIPFYDDGTTPASTRAIAAMAKQLAEPTDPRAQAVLQKLAVLSARQGYRAPEQVLAATKPMLTYPQIDELSERLLTLLGAGGKGNAALLNILRAATLELADDSKNVANADSTLRVVTDLLFRTLRQPGVSRPADADDTWRPPAFTETRATQPMYFVRRGDDGNAIGAAPGQTPFAVPGTPDTQPRDPAGRAQGFTYTNATETLLGALLREQKPLLQRKGKGIASTVEKLLRGIRPLLGSAGNRNYTFTSGRQVAFQGPNLDESPLLDLVHAGATLLRFPETERVLVLLAELIDKYESDANGTVYAGLALDRRADSDPAQLVGWDGTANTESEFWDDLIQVGQRMLERPGMLEAVLRTFAEPSAVAQTSLLAKFMGFKDQLSYAGPRVAAGAAQHTADEVARYNAVVEGQLSVPVDRTQPTRGMNRSLFQRLVSAIHATNGVPNCNKPNSTLSANDPLTGQPLMFPTPAAQPLATNDPLGAGLVAGIATSACPAPGTGITYAECAFVEQPNGAETHMRSMLGRTLIEIKDTQLLCLEEAGLANDLGDTQEASAQITDFTLTPTPQSLARFVHVPRNKFLADLFDPFATKHGVALTDFEPDILFALEAKQNDIQLNGQPASFLDASKDLGTAFDDHELFEEKEGAGDVATRGYMFADLLATLHMHWPAPTAENCPSTIVSGDEGCSQRLDANAPFYAKQSNLQSYEPFLIAAIQEENLGVILQKATARLKDVWIGDVNGGIGVVPANTAGAKDGIGILHDFLALAIKPMEGLTDRKGNASTKTNACVPGTDAMGQATCQENRGRILAQTTPLYLLLDALNAIDALWARPENADRHKTFLEARSELVDQLLTVERDNTTDPANPTYRMRNQRGRALALELISWLRGSVLAKHTSDRDAWATGANGLQKRLRDTLSHPLVAYGLDLFDVVWDDPAAGDDLAALNTYLMDYEQNEGAFLGVLLAAADALEFADREPGVAPVVQFAALAIAPDAFTQIANGASAQPDVEHGAAYTGLELTRKVALLPAYANNPNSLSPISRILKNAVVTPPNGKPPIVALFDAIADVNRTDPAQQTTVPFNADDNQRVFDNLEFFMSDQDRGLERLYKVIAGRDLDKVGTNP